LITINRPLDVVEPPKIRDDEFHGGRCEVHIVNPWNWYDFKSKGVKWKYIDAVSLPGISYSNVLRQISSRPSY